MMKQLKLWSVCLLALAMILIMASCNPSSGGEQATSAVTTTENTVPETNEGTKEPAATGEGTKEPVVTDPPVITPEETKADIRPGKDEEHTWEEYHPFG